MTERLAPYLDGGTTILKDKRKDFRRSGENNVVLTYVPADSGPECGKVLTGIATDISPGGMRIVIGEAVPPEAIVNVRFSLPEKPNPVDLRGRVKWIWSLDEGKAFEAGLDFITPPSESLLDLLEYTYKK